MSIHTSESVFGPPYRQTDAQPNTGAHSQIKADWINQVGSTFTTLFETDKTFGFTLQTFVFVLGNIRQISHYLCVCVYLRCWLVGRLFHECTERSWVVIKLSSSQKHQRAVTSDLSVTQINKQIKSILSIAHPIIGLNAHSPTLLPLGQIWDVMLVWRKRILIKTVSVLLYRPSTEYHRCTIIRAVLTGRLTGLDFDLASFNFTPLQALYSLHGAICIIKLPLAIARAA